MRRWWWSLRRRWLEWRLARVMAGPDAHRIVVLPPSPPCDHPDEVTMPDPFHDGQQITVCAYCSVVVEQQPPRLPDCTNPTGGHRFPAFNMPGEPARGGPCVHCGMPFPTAP